MNEDKKTIPQLDVDTQLLVKRLLDTKDGDIITYRELSKLIGENVQTDKRHLLYSAQRILIRDHSIVFGCVMNEGIKRLNAREVATLGSHHIRRIHGEAGRGMRKLATVNVDKLDNAQRIALLTHCSFLGAIRQMSNANRVRRLQGAVSRANERLSLQETLEAFA